MIFDEARVAAALPGYELGAQLGRGAFGVVLAGRHRELHRDVAIKVLFAQLDETATTSLGEARLLAALDHPHIVRVYDAVVVEDLQLIVMELLGGGTLTRRRASLSPEGACAVGLAVAAALGCAHAQGVLHRDIKPDNMLFDGAGLLKVADFGIAKLVEGAAAAASAVVGTPRYMAPEQLAAGWLSPATDLYAVGIMLYELLAGRPPFGPGLSAPALAHHHLHVVPPPPAGVPAPLADVVMRSLAKDPAARQPSAHVFALDLARAAAQVFGPGWTARAGIRLRLDDEIRAAADQPLVSTWPATASGVRPTFSTGDQPRTGAGGGRPDESDRGRPRPRRRRLVSAAVAVLLAVTGTVVAVISTRGGDSTPHLLGSPLTVPAAMWSVAFSPDGHTLAGADGAGTIRLWDVTDLARPTRLAEQPAASVGQVEEVAFSPDSRTLASAGGKTVQLWNVTDRTRLRPLGESLTGDSDPMYAVAYSPDGKLLASAGGEDAMVLWDVTDRTAPHLLASEPGWTASVAFSPHDDILASGYNQAVQLWDISDRTDIRPLGEPLTSRIGWVYAVAISPNGRILAGAGDDDKVQLWDITNPSAPVKRGELIGHTNVVVSLAFSPDNHTLASASDDHSVRLWDVADPARPRPMGELTGHTDHVSSVAFSPDGDTLVSASADRTVRLWDLG
ncbi:serine/threonine protein kinase [Frankia sp. CNm7]|uniref:Serine/threonine protein kinase n=1 Tax=Frankia nepalensis TaxID=1836974 RepID=A0A937RLR3_9ACTN|nr:serine/threonine-protein kinase [Frankia nepalensis]MBL7495814.1 serine/threonine protein kinase [Frankia nepalensis]MBL7509890.1 serine/threonine protein kinase [Frankia nepalensis]MBL7517643.1 serine/threonine protein kinase [Frankia nepalensis]MBL7629649.1 serine/threonine protein kinase [Frankia nepalensis]